MLQKKWILPAVVGLAALIGSAAAGRILAIHTCGTGWSCKIDTPNPDPDTNNNLWALVKTYYSLNKNNRFEPDDKITICNADLCADYGLTKDGKFVGSNPQKQTHNGPPSAGGGHPPGAGGNNPLIPAIPSIPSRGIVHQPTPPPRLGTGQVNIGLPSPARCGAPDPPCR